ncbi:MAG: hypothetical protein KBC35_04615 [Candidatus Pacebacteria bacterium]|nr:hypothetical protein [Candidatus Paceibacterota bacterium]
MSTYTPKANPNLEAHLIQAKLQEDVLNQFEKIDSGGRAFDLCRSFDDCVVLARSFMEIGNKAFARYSIERCIPYAATLPMIYCALELLNELQGRNVVCGDVRKNLLCRAIPLMSNDPETIEEVLIKFGYI